MMKNSSPDAAYSRSVNVATILRMLYRSDSCTRADLAAHTGISASTVTRIVADLEESHIVSTDFHGESSGGRRPTHLRLNHERIFAVAVQVQRNEVQIGLSDARGQLLDRRIFRPYALEPHFLLREISVTIQRLLADHDVPRERVLGVGVSAPGVLDGNANHLVKSLNLGWSDVPIAAMMNEHLDLPVYTRNDADASALGEYWFGHAHEYRNFLFIKTDAGIGVGVFLDGRLFPGSTHRAGEIGHIPLVTQGAPCQCGQRGCLEPYLYIDNLRRQYQTQTGKDLTIDTLFAAEDSVTGRMMEEAQEVFTRTIGLAGFLLDLDAVIVGGLWGRRDKQFLEPVRQRFEKVAEASRMGQSVEILGSSLGEDEELRSAAAIVIDHWLEIPSLSSN